MNITITETSTGRKLWRGSDCANHCGVSPSTWRSYTRAKNKINPPQPATHLDARTPLWYADEVKDWHANRPGSPVTNHPTAKKA